MTRRVLVLRRCFAVTIVLAVYSVAQFALAHVVINSPNGGETLMGGSSHVIEWMPDVAPHDTQKFDVWYSTASADGPWTSIATNLPPGDLSVGSLHSFSWTVPDLVDASAWIRVRQENIVDSDYEDVSDASFAIAAAIGLAGDYNGNDVVDAADYTLWRNSLGQQGAGLAADGNHDNRVDAVDYSLWKSNFGDTAGAGALGAVVVPEPGAWAWAATIGLGLWKTRGSRSSRSRGFGR
jgi:hypothetical protein